MKLFSDFIIEEIPTKNYEVYEYLLSDLTDIHFWLEDNIRKDLKVSYFRFNESHGVYDGQLKFISVLVKNIYIKYFNHALQKSLINYPKTLQVNSKNLTNFLNIFFDKITFVLDNSIKDSGYISQDNFNKDSNKLNEVLIKVNISNNANYSDFYIFCCHELTHAWQDYQLQSSGKFSIKINNVNYSKYIKDMNNSNSIQSILNRLFYLLDLKEVNAYISELGALIETSKPNNIKDAIDLLKTSETYMTYSVYFDYILKLNNAELTELVNAYRKYNNTKLSDSKIYDKIKSRLLYIINKINTIYPKLYFDYINSQQTDEHMMVRPSSAFIYLLKEMLNFLQSLEIEEI